MKVWQASLLFVAAMLATVAAAAHEIRPAYFELRENSSGDIDILWKQPTSGETMLAIRPHLSSGWLDEEATQVAVTESALLRQWHIAAPHAPVAGQTLTIAGLEVTLTDVLVSIRYADGRESSQVIHASQPSLVIPEHDASFLGWRYLRLGVMHIWSGADHLLYVLGLLLLAAALRPLIWTLTSFTLAHSITLGLAALNVVHVPRAPVEAVIALSIVYLAVELLRQTRGLHGLASERPWLVAFPFGLLHGFGFAGALQDVGLPASDVPTVLLFFNLGVEAGQILFVLAALALGSIMKLQARIAAGKARKWAAYTLGSIASYWLIARLALL